MPFQNGYFFGNEARTVVKTARDALIEYLETTLNDASGAYAAALGITPELPAVVTPSQENASELFTGAERRIIVLVWPGATPKSTAWGKTVNDVFYDGKRHEITLLINMGVSDGRPENTPPPTAIDASEADSLLASFVCDAVESGCSNLALAGLHNVEIAPDEERQAGRGAHRVTCFCLTLNNYLPA